MSMNILERLRRVFTEELGLDGSQEPEEFAYGVNPEWDSVAHIHLILALEAEFGVDFDDRQVATLTAFPRIVSVLERHFHD